MESASYVAYCILMHLTENYTLWYEYFSYTVVAVVAVKTLIKQFDKNNY